MNITLARHAEHYQFAAQVLHELRPHLSEQAIEKQIAVQAQQGFQVAIAWQDERAVGVAGYWIQHKLAWGKHVYIDDLVTLPACRGQGVGEHLLSFVCEQGKAQQCVSLHLDSGVQRFDAHRFYLRHGMRIASHHFCSDLVP
ncbi:GNAT family N-acetyltransferase [Aestuariibacter halophilus]|uniref:GNAT family N-acetyltransferase n=1 Tax=Fluctibacter halophilus TaxID=226011 RepID=A0ABS8G4N5_9ALTE|nr:GNAT family N-acetyltransferase [Aestuariibacter halophilus]MCC2615469.1 GNAT family N-acetyltransferase [Aestuariibacter halophilus]